MVYIYVCKRFKNTMEMVSGRDGEWVNNVLQFYCKHGRINGKLERAEINPKKRTTVCAYDSSTDVFKINLVYKDSSGKEHELKWVVKVTRSDVNQVAETLLRHEKQVRLWRPNTVLPCCDLMYVFTRYTNSRCTRV